MTTYLIIAGHGPQRNGTFDLGATGFLIKGKTDYLEMIIFR